MPSLALLSVLILSSLVAAGIYRNSLRAPSHRNLADRVRAIREVLGLEETFQSRNRVELAALEFQDQSPVTATLHRSASSLGWNVRIRRGEWSRAPDPSFAARLEAGLIEQPREQPPIEPAPELLQWSSRYADWRMWIDGEVLSAVVFTNDIATLRQAVHELALIMTGEVKKT